MHLYLHVPFCARRCSYCDFAIAVRRYTPSSAYREAVLREWEGWRGSPLWTGDPAVRSIYFGGGTPSRLDPVDLAEIIEAITAGGRLAADAEVTLETNPDDVTPERAAAWIDAGVNRISLGVQSFDPAVLAWMHRTHSADQVPEAVETLRAAGIRNLSLDLIYALPAALERDWGRDLEGALALSPQHLSLYGLTVEPCTPLFRWTARGEVQPAVEDRAADEYLHAQARLRVAGFQAYEVSNAAQPGFASRHNSAYWSGSTFIGLGPSAHGGTASARWWNVREWVEYQRLSEAGRPVLAGREELDPAQRRLEELYLGLRTSRGVPRDRIPAGMASQWESEGWAVLEGDQVRLTPHGWLRLDALVAAVPDP